MLRNLQMRPDMKSYGDMVCEGKLYESLCNNLPRDIAKKHLFEAVFFGRHKHHYALEEDFKKLYPGVYDFIRATKRKDYRHLAHALQRTESQFVIHTVCNRLMRDHPDLPVLTIHDSILTSDPVLVRNIMAHEFWKLGLMPQLRVEAA